MPKVLDGLTLNVGGAAEIDSREKDAGGYTDWAFDLRARYKINDSLAATLNIGLITPLSKVDGDETKYGPQWRVTPAVQVYADSNASVWAGLALTGMTV